MHITANGVSLFYKKSGNGDPLVLLHGNGEDHRIFDAITEKLQDRFTVYAVDSRNHGQSEKTDVYAYETMAEDVHGFIEALDIAPAYIAGFSDGAIISLILAMRHPEALRKMALLGVNLKPADFTDRCYEYVKTTYEETGDPLFKMMLEQPDISLADVKNVQTPALLVAAEKDLYKPELYPALVKAMPQAELKMMYGHKHETYIVGQAILADDFIRFFC